MNIKFSADHLRKTCTEIRRASRKFGEVRAEALFRRLTELQSVNTMADLYSLPHHHLEKLKGDLKDWWSVRVDSAFRIVFRPFAEAPDKLELSPDGSVNLKKVVSVLVREVGDYHD